MSCRILHRLVNACTCAEFYERYVKLPSENTPLASEIEENPKLFPYLKDCLGAGDGSHFLAFVCESLRARCRNRKGDISQNVFAVCDFAMRFLYVVAGWEGSVSDSRMYEDARSSTFTIPANKYYLGDAGFPLCDHLLVPYRGVRYHLKEWGRANAKYTIFTERPHKTRLTHCRPQNYKELFNLRHSQARNVIERVFGIFKKRFKVLVSTPEYAFPFQAKLVQALIAIHNYIRIHDPDDKPTPDDDHTTPETLQDSFGGLQEHVSSAERARATKRRDDIAQAMWNGYKECRVRRGTL
jgi:hypothetical protein